MTTDYLRRASTLLPARASTAAGSRYQAKREHPAPSGINTWLAQQAALVQVETDRRSPDGLSWTIYGRWRAGTTVCVMHTSTPSFSGDVKVALALKAENPRLTIGMVGAAVAVTPEACMQAGAALDFVAGSEFDFTIQEVAQGRALKDVQGLSYRVNGHVTHTAPRPILENMDACRRRRRSSAT